MHGRLEPRDSGSYCSCPGMKRKGRFDGIHGNRKGKIGKSITLVSFSSLVISKAKIVCSQNVYT